MATELGLIVSALTNAVLVTALVVRRNPRGGPLRELTNKFDAWQASFALYLQRRLAEDASEGTRWVALVATSPSGKSQWTCTCCGRVSTTPDVTCPVGALVTAGGVTKVIPCTYKAPWKKDTSWTTKH